MIPYSLRQSIKKAVPAIINGSRHLRGAAKRPSASVLCYHSISEVESSVSIRPDTLREQIRLLKGRGFTFMTFGQLGRLIASPPAQRQWPRDGIIVLTFDDGYEDNLTTALPILSAEGVSATVFMTSGLLTRDAEVLARFAKLVNHAGGYLSSRQLRQLVEAGIEIGAHTHTHRNLAKLSAEEAGVEVSTSKAIIEDAIGGAVDSFAYPFGKRAIHYGSQTVGIVRDAGFSAAAAVAFRRVFPREKRVFEIPRFFVSGADTRESLLHKVAGDYDWLGQFHERSPRWLKARVAPEEDYA